MHMEDGGWLPGNHSSVVRDLVAQAKGSLVPRPRPAFRRFQYLGTRLGQGSMVNSNKTSALCNRGFYGAIWPNTVGWISQNLLPINASESS